MLTFPQFMMIGVAAASVVLGVVRRDYLYEVYTPGGRVLELTGWEMALYKVVKWTIVMALLIAGGFFK